MTGESIAAEMREALDRGGAQIALSRLSFLALLVNSSRPMRVSEISVLLGLTRPSSYRLAKSLVDAGEARSIPDPEDERSMLLEATQAGQDTLEKAAEAVSTLSSTWKKATTLRYRPGHIAPPCS